MAAEATHVILAEIVFDEHFSHLSKRDFLIGTLFPDIRYLGVIGREATHPEPVSLELVTSESNAFTAGLKFHNLVDLVREEFMVEHGIYTLVQESRYLVHAVKLLEEERYYDRLRDWSRVRASIVETIDDQKTFGVAEPSLQKWYGLLSEYFAIKPTDTTRERFMLELGFKKEAADAVNGCVAELRTNQVATKIIDDFIVAFPGLLKADPARSYRLPAET